MEAVCTGFLCFVCGFPIPARRIQRTGCSGKCSRQYAPPSIPAGMGRKIGFGTSADDRNQDTSVLPQQPFPDFRRYAGRRHRSMLSCKKTFPLVFIPSKKHRSIPMLFCLKQIFQAVCQAFQLLTVRLFVLASPHTGQCILGKLYKLLCLFIFQSLRTHTQTL